MRSHILQHRTSLRALLTAFAIAVTAPQAQSQIVPQYERHTPLSQWQTPGTAAGMAQMAGKGDSSYFQPIRVILDGGGDVSVYHSRPATPFKQASPAQFGVLVGHMHRLTIGNIPDLPGVELYPTIEILDRLHPPRGQKHNFPILIHIDQRDIDLALAGNLVTRVVYLEQPQIAAPFELDEATRARDLDKKDNAMAQADRYGRPMVIVRLGGRVPSAHGEPDRFWGSGGPVSLSKPYVIANPDAEVKPQAVYGFGPQSRRTPIRQTPIRDGRLLPVAAQQAPPRLTPEGSTAPRRKASQP
jgi:hypothetical protein